MGANRKRPLFTSVAERIAEMIDSGVYGPDDQLPPESRLAESLGVSRVTLREALRVLEEDGRIIRRHGRGTFVARRGESIVSRLELNLGVSEVIGASGRSGGTSLVSLSKEAADSYLARKLLMDPGSPVLVIERVRTADGRPVVHTVDVIPEAVVGGLDQLEGLPLNGSLYRMLEGRFGQVISEGAARITPAKADPILARKLRVEPGSLLLMLEQVDSTADGRPVVYSREYYVKDAFEFTIRRRRKLDDAPGGALNGIPAR